MVRNPARNLILTMKKAFFILFLLFLSNRQVDANIKNAFNQKNMADFKAYMNTPLRKALTSSSNNGTKDTPGHPRADDAGNWTGCSNGSGQLVGTYRDISACMLTQVLGRPATYLDLKALTQARAEELIKIWFWDKLELDKVKHQETANICAHIFMHYGNVKVIQDGLNTIGAGLTADGRTGPATLAAIQKFAGVRGYNAIRAELKRRYETNSVVIYRKPFLDALEKNFPVLDNSKIIFFFRLDSSFGDLVYSKSIEIQSAEISNLNKELDAIKEEFKQKIIESLKKYS